MSATIGLGACVVALLVSLVYALGLPPAWLYGALSNVKTLSSNIEVVGIPLEAIGAVWFGIVAVRSFSRRELSQDALLCFWGGAIVAGLHGRVAWGSGLNTVSSVAATVAALTVMALSSPPLQHLLRLSIDNVVEYGKSIRLAPGRSVAFAFLALCALSAVPVAKSVWSIEPSKARLLAFSRWFDAQEPQISRLLAHEAPLVVTAFVDYECPFSRANVTRAKETIDRKGRALGVDVVMVLRDFPIDKACNRFFAQTPHKSACYAAEAVRLIESIRGRAAADELSTELLSSPLMLSPTQIADRLDRLQLPSEDSSLRTNERASLLKDITEAVRLGVRQTPTFFVNGVQLKGSALSIDTAMEYIASLEGGRRQGGV